MLEPRRFGSRDTLARVPVGRHRPDLWRADAVRRPVVTRAARGDRDYLPGPEREWAASRGRALAARLILAGQRGGALLALCARRRDLRLAGSAPGLVAVQFLAQLIQMTLHGRWRRSARYNPL